jgi:hypothetical protein
VLVAFTKNNSDKLEQDCSSSRTVAYKLQNK